MNDRIRDMQRRGKLGVVVFTVLWVAMCSARLAGFDFLAWCLAPFAAAAFAFTTRTIVITARMRAQHQREVEQRAAQAARREKLRQQLHTLAAPDAVDGQCPVCGLDDLDDLAAVDAQLEEGADSRFRRVVTYGKRRAHAECAELVPYKPSPVEAAIAEHELNHHGAQIARMIGCPLCAQETREQLADEPDLDQPLPPPNYGMTTAEINRALTALTNAFRVQPMIVGEPASVTEITEREARAQLEELARRERNLRAAMDSRLLIAPNDWRRQLGLPPYPNEKGSTR